MKIIYSFILIFVFYSSIITAQPQTGQFALSFTDRTITSNIFFSVPTDYDSTKSYPFLLAYHGAGDTGSNMRNAMNVWLANRVGAILVCPDANSVNGQDVSYFTNLLSASYAHTRGTYNIDSTKLIIMGFSWGGAYSYQMGLLNPQMFTGIIGLAPAIGNIDQTMWGNVTKVRMATILGTNDFNFTVVKSLMTQITNAGGNLLYIEKPGVQHVDANYFNSEEIKTDFKACYDFVTGAVTAVEENNLQPNSNVNIFPNPVNDYSKIEVNLPSKEIIEYTITNLAGVEIRKYTSTIPVEYLIKEISLSDAPQGIYFINVKAGSFAESKKIIKIE